MDLQRAAVNFGQRPALVLVDLINGFTDPACALGCECSDTISANTLLLNAMRAASLPVFFTQQIHNRDAASVFGARIAALSILTPKSHWTKIDRRMGRLEHETIIKKEFPSAFFNTSLMHELGRAGADTLIVTGLTTSGCVRATVVDGLQHDFPVFVPREAVADRNQEAHAANLFDMHAKYAEVETKYWHVLRAFAVNAVQ